jgi:amino-acid N-acetyltransferase
VIRAAEPDDRAAVLELLAAANLPGEGVDDHFLSFFVADEGGRIVGAAGLELYGRHALLRSVVVAADARGTGLGSILTRRALDEAALRDVLGVYLLTTTAEAFFEKLGFERVMREDAPATVRESTQFRGACPDTAIAMRLQTSPASDDR